MEYVTHGHWLFAGIFLLLFLFFLGWAYRKDLSLHKIHYGKTVYVAVGIVLVLFVFYVAKQFLL